MNQILVTGEERLDRDKKIKEQYEGYMDKQLKDRLARQNKVKDYTGEKSVAQTKKFASIFAILIIILGICIIVGGIYTKNKINETAQANAKPSIEFKYNEENATVDIAVSHIRGIKEITYQINDNEEKKISGNNQKNVKTTAELEGGNNTLVVTATEENGQYVKYTQNYTVQIIPEIALEAIENGIKITAKSKNIIDYITYKWDDGEETKIEVNNEKYEGTINVKRGKHNLTVNAVDKNGKNKTITTPVTGKSEPSSSIKLGMRNRRLYFLINVESEVNITNIKITINEEEKENKQVSNNKYNTEIEVKEGINKIVLEIEENDGTKTERKYILDTNEIKEEDIIYE